MVSLTLCLALFFFNDPPTTEIYTLSLHDALPISGAGLRVRYPPVGGAVRHPRHCGRQRHLPPVVRDRKSTRLNSSHPSISYAVFCLKKKNNATMHSMAYNVLPACLATSSPTRHVP